MILTIKFHTALDRNLAALELLGDRSKLFGTCDNGIEMIAKECRHVGRKLLVINSEGIQTSIPWNRIKCYKQA